MRKTISILYVDDNPHDRELVREALADEPGGFVLTEAPSRAEFERLLGSDTYDLVLSDFNILGFQGIQVLDAVHSRRASLPVVIVTGTGSEEIAVEAMKRGAADYVIKSPKHIKRLPATILAAIERSYTKEERDLLFNCSNDLLSIAGFDGKFRQISPSWEKTLGWPIQEILAHPYTEFVHPEDREETHLAMKKIEEGLTQHQFENRYRDREGRYHWLWWNSYCLPQERRIFSVARDISERKHAEKVIRLSLREKEILLREIHHRVKNNLQLISSLLSLQIAGISDLKVLRAFEETQHRIRAMASVHERLLASPELAGIDFGDFLKSLTYELLSACGRPEVTPSLDVDPVVLGIDTAIPCGLIVDELVTNSLKHAFPGGRRGTISLGLHLRGDRQVELVVGDDGVGFPKDADFRSMNTMGMILVTSLTQQIDASIDLRGGGGTTFSITFKG